MPQGIVHAFGGKRNTGGITPRRRHFKGPETMTKLKSLLLAISFLGVKVKILITMR
jgi:hypothetical protein